MRVPPPINCRRSQSCRRRVVRVDLDPVQHPCQERLRTEWHRRHHACQHQHRVPGPPANRSWFRAQSPYVVLIDARTNFLGCGHLKSVCLPAARDPILRFNQALATPALSSAGLAKFGPIRDLISRSFVQIEGSLREGRLVPIALPWSIKGTRLTYSATSRFPGPAPNPPPGARAQVYDPRRLDIASLRPLNYENAFLDARRAFSPLTEQEEAEVTAAESLEKAATAAAGADMKARTRATNSLEQDFSRRRDRQLVECLSGCDRISQDSIFVGVDPGERYALAATVFSRGSSDQPRMPRAYTVRSTSISEIDKQEQQVQALWQQSSHLVRIQSAVCAGASHSRRPQSYQMDLSLTDSVPKLQP